MSTKSVDSFQQPYKNVLALVLKCLEMYVKVLLWLIRIFKADIALSKQCSFLQGWILSSQDSTFKFLSLITSNFFLLFSQLLE